MLTARRQAPFARAWLSLILALSLLIGGATAASARDDTDVQGTGCREEWVTITDGDGNVVWDGPAIICPT